MNGPRRRRRLDHRRDRAAARAPDRRRTRSRASNSTTATPATSCSASSIARASGQSLAEFSRRQIFEPLGMKNTSIVDRYPAPIPALARGYRQEGAGLRHRRDRLGAGRRRPGAQRRPRPRALGREFLHRQGRRPRAGRADVRGRPAEFRQVHGLCRRAQRLRVARPHLGHARRFLGRLPLEHRARAGRALLGDRAVQPCRRGCRRLSRREVAEMLPAGQARPRRGGPGEARNRNRSRSRRRGIRATCRAMPVPITARRPTRAACIDQRGAAPRARGLRAKARS